MMFGGSCLYQNYPWSKRVEKLAKQKYVENGGKLPDIYDDWHRYGEEIHQKIENEKFDAREKKKIDRMINAKTNT